MSESKLKERDLETFIASIDEINDPSGAAYLVAGYRLGRSAFAGRREVIEVLDDMTRRCGLNRVEELRIVDQTSRK